MPASPAVPPRRLPTLPQHYLLTLEAALVVALLSIGAAFRLPLYFTPSFEVTLSEQEAVHVEEITPTQQVEKPPPPPRPRLPVPVADDLLLDDEEEALAFDAMLDLDAAPTVPSAPPPPPPQASEEAPEPEVFVVVEQMPVLIGGLAGLQQHLRYPEMARRAGVEGRVYVQFVVDEAGRVRDPVVIRGIGAGCDEEALRAVAQARFLPGRQRGVPVRVQYVLPVRFALK